VVRIAAGIHTQRGNPRKVGGAGKERPSAAATQEREKQLHSKLAASFWSDCELLRSWSNHMRTGLLFGICEPPEVDPSTPVKHQSSCMHAAQSPNCKGATHWELATAGDAGAIAHIYNQGIEDGTTFQTQMCRPSRVLNWLESYCPTIVVRAGSEVLAFARSEQSRDWKPFVGIVDVSVFVRRDSRGRGFGRLAMEGLIHEATHKRYRKMLAWILADNISSFSLAVALGFRKVGVYKKHVKLSGNWKDIVLLEKLIE
jgi:L-amino acid N-acyltransferase YncA